MLSKCLTLSFQYFCYYTAYLPKLQGESLCKKRNEKCGKKILISGNGRCNYFNENQNTEKYHSSNPELIKNIIKVNGKSVFFTKK